MTAFMSVIWRLCASVKAVNDGAVAQHAAGRVGGIPLEDGPLVCEGWASTTRSSAMRR